MPRQLDAEFAEVVRVFRGRRRWRHVLAMIIGAVALILGTAVVAGRLAHHGTPGLPSLGAGAGLYAAGTLAFGWGAAGGFTSRLATWLPASLVFGALAVLVFVLAAMFSGTADGVMSNGRPEAGSRSPGPRSPGQTSRTGSSSAASGQVLAAGLADGGYVRHHDGRSGRVTRVRASRGDWVVALQLRTAAGAGDPAQLLAADVRHMLDLLTAAGPAGPGRQRALNGYPANRGGHERLPG